MSKEMERFVADVQKDEGLAKLVHEKAGNLKSLSAALKEHGYEATDDEIKAFFRAEAKKQNIELSDEDLDAVAGGGNYSMLQAVAIIRRLYDPTATIY